MSNDLEYRRRRQVREARLNIVAPLYKKGYTVRKIREEVMRRLNLTAYSLSTVQSDINTLLKEWREYRLTNTEDLVQLELARIDDTVRELWEQWEKSKEDYIKTHRKRKGAPVRNDEQQDGNNGEGNIRTYSIEEDTSNVVGLGNPAYIAEIRQQLMERRKLLGLYAPEKKDITGDLSFAAFLMESGMIDEAENSIGDLTQEN
jgi:hypothetical protein